VFSTGTFYIPGQRRGWRDAHGGAGWTDLRKSISASVNFYYYKLAYEMGIERFDQYMRKYGFGQPTGIDLAGENKGVVPSPEWKRTRSKEPWYAGETVNAGIGQGYWIATVLQLVRGTSAIANGGNLVRPHLVAARRDGYATPWVPLPQPTPSRITDSASNLRAVQEGMIATIHGGGTGAAMARGAPYMMAGKTGTAQKISRKGSVSFDPHNLPYNLRHQALFVGYAPADNPTIAVAVSVEHGGFGGSTAAPIARKIFDAYLLGKMPEPVESDPKSVRPRAPDAAPPDEEDAPPVPVMAPAGVKAAAMQPPAVPVLKPAAAPRQATPEPTR
jgi:penicillin-binding protein 2